MLKFEKKNCFWHLKHPFTKVVVKLGSVLLLIEIKHWKGILWLYSDVQGIWPAEQAFLFCFVLFCLFFSKCDLKEYEGIIFWLAQISVSWKSMSIVQQNSPALQARAIANHPTIKFTIEVWEIETTFLDTRVYKGKRFEKKESSMCVHILSLLKHFSTHTPTAVTQRTLKKALPKEKLSGF